MGAGAVESGGGADFSVAREVIGQRELDTTTPPPAIPVQTHENQGQGMGRDNVSTGPFPSVEFPTEFQMPDKLGSNKLENVMRLVNQLENAPKNPEQLQALHEQFDQAISNLSPDDLNSLMQNLQEMIQNRDSSMLDILLMRVNDKISQEASNIVR